MVSTRYFDFALTPGQPLVERTHVEWTLPYFRARPTSIHYAFAR